MMAKKKQDEILDLTTEGLVELIRKDRFPKSIGYSQKVQIRDWWLEGKVQQAVNKLREYLEPKIINREKSLL